MDAQGVAGGAHSDGASVHACMGWCGRSSVSCVSALGMGSCERLVAMGACRKPLFTDTLASRPTRCFTYPARAISCSEENGGNKKNCVGSVDLVWLLFGYLVQLVGVHGSFLEFIYSSSIPLIASVEAYVKQGVNCLLYTSPSPRD